MLNVLCLPFLQKVAYYYSIIQIREFLMFVAQTLSEVHVGNA